jgi:multicomponent Na+:H+ antiporter subunit A
MRRSLILDTTVRLVTDGALVLSVYFLFAGHNQPGGGFVGGLVAAAALALRYVAGGLDGLLKTMRVRPPFLLALGLVLTTGAALVPLTIGDTPLDQRAFEGTFMLLGKVKFTTATIFDTGVYLIVVGLVLTIFIALGGDDAEAVPDSVPEAST